MSEIIKFPLPDARDWREVATPMREWMFEQGMDRALVDWVVESLRTIWMKRVLAIDVPVEMKDIASVQRLARFYKDKGAELFGELLIAYIRIYRLEHGE